MAQTLTLAVGPHRYEIHRRYDLRDGEQNERADALFVSTGSIKAIFLDATLDSASAVDDALRHEYQHAWEHHTAVPQNAEDRAQFSSTIGMAYAAALKEAGGVEAVLALPIEGMPDASRRPWVALEGMSGDKIECGACEATIAVGSIEQTPLPTRTARGTLVVECWAQCPACSSVTAWREAATADGERLGAVFFAKLMRGEDARQFMLNVDAARSAPF